MKISQEHIDAALKWSDCKPHLPSEFTSGDMAVLLDYQCDGSFASTTAASMNILAAAYRELLAENERLKESFREILSAKMQCSDVFHEIEEVERIARKALNLEP